MESAENAFVNTTEVSEALKAIVTLVDAYTVLQAEWYVVGLHQSKGRSEEDKQARAQAIEQKLLKVHNGVNLLHPLLKTKFEEMLGGL